MSNHIPRRSCLKLFGAAVLAPASIPGLYSDKAFAKSEPFVVTEGIQRGAESELQAAFPLVQAKYGVKMDIKSFGDGSSAILALSQKQLDMANLTVEHVIRSIDQDMGLVVVVGSSGGHAVIVAAKNVSLPPNDLAALKSLIESRKARNKVKFSVPTGSLEHLRLVYLLSNLGVNIDLDVQIVNMGFAEQPRALSDNEVDLAMCLSSFAALAIVNGSATLFQHVYGGAAHQWEIGYATRRDLIESDPGLIQRVVNTHVAAEKLYMNNTAERIKLAETESSFPPAVIKMDETDFLKFTYRIDLDDIRATAKEMYKLGWTKRDLSDQVDRHVDYSFLEKATGESKERLMQF